MTMPPLPPNGDTSWGVGDWAAWVHDQAAKVFNKLGISDLSATGTPSATTVLHGDNTWKVPTSTVADASTTVKGIAELATDAETVTGTDTARATTPAGVKAVADTKAALVHASRHAAGGADPLAASQVGMTVAGMAATDVQGGFLELLDMADDSGDNWSSTALTLELTAGVYKADSDLNVAIGIGQAVWLDYYMTFSGTSAGTANLRAQLTAPTGCSAEWGSALDYDAAGSAGAAKGTLGSLSDTRTFVLNGTSPTGLHIRAKVWGATAAGNIVLNLAPNTTVASGPPVRNIWARVAYTKAA